VRVATSRGAEAVDGRMSTSYADAVAQLSRPTDQQIDDFVEYVATAHSWYKHLPLLPPGVPFVFYLDPNAGREWIENGWRSRFRDRLANAPAHERFHYTWQPTSDYVRRFGHLTYFANAGTFFLVPRKDRVLNTDSAPRIQVEHRQWLFVNRSWIAVPEYVRGPGTAYLTGVIHPIGQSVDCWILEQHLANTYGATHLDLLSYDASSADDTVRTVVQLMRRVFTHSEHVEELPEVVELESRVLPAWAQTQKRQMNQAIHRMLDCTHRGWVSQPAV
jgi:hypothetical protein